MLLVLLAWRHPVIRGVRVLPQTAASPQLATAKGT
jgi:hypothetical protein